MRLRKLASALVTLLLCGLGAYGVASPDAVNVSIPATTPASVAGHVVDDNFLGISIELAALGQIWGNTTNDIPNAMLNYLANINARMGSAPLRIRIGGNSMDASSYTPSFTKELLQIDDTSHSDYILVTYGPVLFTVLNAVADAVGDLSFLIGLSTQRAPADSGESYALAGAAKGALGERLDSLLLGNEPDLYGPHGVRPNYTIPDYIADLGQYIDGIQQYAPNSPLNETILGGPGVCCYWDLDDVVNAGTTQYPYKYFSAQHYAFNSCQGDNSQNTNMSWFATHANIPAYFNWAAGVSAAQAAGVAAIVTEFNTVSCGGSSLSDTLVAGMWLLDTALTFASANISSAFMHTREPGVLYNLFDPPEKAGEATWTTRASYYSLLAGSEVFRGGGSVWDLNLEGGKTSQRATSAGYAIYTDGRPARLVLFNYADAAGQARNFTIPKGHGRLGVRLLEGQSLAASGAGMSWAGQSVALGGILEGTSDTRVVDCADGCELAIPGPAMALVVLDIDGRQNATLWEGNTTIAQPVGSLSSVASGRWSGTRTFVLSVVCLVITPMLA